MKRFEIRCTFLTFVTLRVELTISVPSAEFAESFELWRSWVSGNSSDGPFLVVPRGATLPAIHMTRIRLERAFKHLGAR
jgi:hypothetical protein